LTHLASSLVLTLPLHLKWSAILVSLHSISPWSSTNLSYLILVSTICIHVQTWPSSRPVPHSLNLLVGKLLPPKLYASVPVTIGFTAPALAVYYTMYNGMYCIVTFGVLAVLADC